MKKLFNLFILTFFVLLNYSTSLAQTTYTWDGSSSTDWNTAANWTPATVPTSSDHVILANVTNDPVLDANRTVNNLTLSAGTVLDLGGYTITVSGTATMNAGTVQNGVFYKTTGSVSFAGVTMDCEVDVDATTTISSTNHFIGEARLQKITGWTGNCHFEAKADLKLTHYNTFFGGNVFNDTTIITAASAQGYSQGIGYSAVDSFYAPVTINAILHQNFYFGNATGGTWFGDDVTINNFGTTNTHIYIGGHASSVNHFEGDIFLNTDSTAGHISFNLGTNIHDGELLFGDRGYNSGVLTLKAYAQSGAHAIDLSGMDHTSTLILGPDLTLEGALNGPNKNTTLYANCTFKDDVTLQKILGWSGYTTCEGKADLKMVNYNTFVGGNVYMDTTIITAASAQGYSQRIGHVVPDTFLAPVTIQMLNNQDLYIGNGSAGNYYADDVTIKNSGYGSSKIYVNSGSTTSSTFNGDIYVESTSGGGIHFYAGTIDHHGLLKVGPSGFSSGILTLTEYTQLTSGTINLSSISGTSSISVLSDADITADFNYSGSRPITLTGATFRGNVDVEAASLPVTNCEFHGTTRLEKTGAGTNNLNGGNTFHGATTLENSSSANYVYWGNSVADTFMTDLTLINHSTQPLWMNYTSTGHYAGDITLQGTSGKVIRFGNSTAGRVAVFNGSSDQHLTVSTSGLDVQLYRAQVNKSGGRLKLNNDAKVDYELALTKGIIETTNGAMLSLADNVAPTASDSSYVEGKVKKIGNDAFTFPVGRNGVYRPIGIGAPSSTSDAFTAEYFESNSDWVHSHSSRDGSLDHLSTNEYWELSRNVGSSTPMVTLRWDTITSCTMDTPLTSIHVAGWDGSNWDDLGNGATTGTIDAGTVRTTSGVSSFNMFVLESDGGMGCRTRWTIDTTFNLTALTIWDTLVHLQWPEFNDAVTYEYMLEYRSADSIFFALDSIESGNLIDIMTLPDSLINTIQNIEYSTEGEPGFIINDLVRRLDDVFDTNYRVRINTNNGIVYSNEASIDVRRDMPQGPTLALPSNCPPLGTPPSGSTAIDTHTFILEDDDECCIVTATLFEDPLHSCDVNPMVCPLGSTDCECACTFDPCCAHFCAGAGNCNCHPWQSCSPEGTTWVIVEVTPIEDITIIPVDPICEGECANLMLSVPTDGSWHFEWFLGASASGIPISYGSTLTVCPTTTTEYTLYFITPPDLATTNACSPEISITVVVNPLPEVSITPDHSITCGDVTVLNAYSGTGGYLWNIGETSPVIYVAPQSTTTYTVTYTNTYGCEDSDDVTVTVIQPVGATISGPESTCDNGSGEWEYSIPYDATDQSVTWIVPSGIAFTDNGHDIVVTDWGAAVWNGAEICVEVLNEGDCVESSCIEIEGCCEIDAGDDVSVCEGFEHQLEATYDAGFSYSWSPTAGLSDPNIYNPVATPLVTTVYTVTITTPGNIECSDEVEITVEDIDPSIVISGCDYTCENDMPCTLSVSVPGWYMDVTWYVPYPSIVYTISGNDLIVSSWGDQYGEDISIGVTAHDDEKYKCNYIELKGCCIPPSSEVAMVVNLGVSDFNATAGAPAVVAGVISEDFTVTGTMTVDQNLTLAGCEVTLAEDATIEVLSPFTLTITDDGTDNSWLHACGDFLWHKLIVQEGGNLIIESNTNLSPPTTIEDAYFATLFKGDGVLDIRNSVYDNNFYAVYVEDFTPANLADTINVIISNNVFQCSDGLNTNSDGTTGCYSGIYGRNSTLVRSGTAPSDGNLDGNNFEDLHFGICGHNSSLSVYGSTFDNIRMVDQWGGSKQYSGWGISTTDYSGVGTDLVVLKNNTFDDSDNAMLVRSQRNVLILGTLITNMDGGSSNLTGYGIKCTGTKDGALIQENNITNAEIGIGVYNSVTDDSEWVRIIKNQIDQFGTVQTGLIGISVSGFNWFDPVNIEIGGSNGISPSIDSYQFIKDMTFGIQVSSLRNPIIHHNEVTLPTTLPTFYQWGIFAMNSSTPQIVMNKVIGSGDAYQIGLVGYITPNGDFRCNNVSNSEYGLSLSGPTVSCRVMNNVMEDCVNGITTSSGNLNNQGSPSTPSDNQWIETNSTFTCHTKRTYSNGMYSGATFYVRSSGATYNPTPFEACLAGSTNNVFAMNSIVSGGSESGIDCDELPMFSPPDQGHAKSIALDTLTYYGEDSLALREMNRWALYGTLKHDTVYSIDSVYQAFIDTMNMTAYKDLDSILQRLTFPMDTALADGLLDLNVKITTTDTLQSLLKEVLTIGLQHYFTDDSTWTSQNILDLREYASLCPFKYGIGVYHARDLLMQMDTMVTIYANNCEKMIAPSGRYAAPEESIQEGVSGTLRIYPNPTTGSVTIECHLNEGDVAELMVFDMSGRQVYRNNKACGANTVELNGLGEGIYQCLLVVNGKASLSEKLVILKE